MSDRSGDLPNRYKTLVVLGPNAKANAPRFPYNNTQAFSQQPTGIDQSSKPYVVIRGLEPRDLRELLEKR